MQAEIQSFFDQLSEPAKSVALNIHSSIMTAKEGLNVEIKWSRPVYSAYGQNFAYIQTNKKHLNFGFYNFINIRSHRDKLEGTGKNLRHIKIPYDQKIDFEMIQILTREASEGA